MNPLNHVAIIMDGNRRWAVSNKLPTYEGHRKGAENLWNVIRNVERSRDRRLVSGVYYQPPIAISLFSLF